MYVHAIIRRMVQNANIYQTLQQLNLRFPVDESMIKRGGPDVSVPYNKLLRDLFGLFDPRLNGGRVFVNLVELGLDITLPIGFKYNSDSDTNNVSGNAENANSIDKTPSNRRHSVVHHIHRSCPRVHTLDVSSVLSTVSDCRDFLSGDLVWPELTSIEIYAFIARYELIRSRSNDAHVNNGVEHEESSGSDDDGQADDFTTSKRLETAAVVRSLTGRKYPSLRRLEYHCETEIEVIELFGLILRFWSDTPGSIALRKRVQNRWNERQNTSGNNNSSLYERCDHTSQWFKEVFVGYQLASLSIKQAVLEPDDQFEYQQIWASLFSNTGSFTEGWLHLSHSRFAQSNLGRYNVFPCLTHLHCNQWLPSQHLMLLMRPNDTPPCSMCVISAHTATAASCGPSALKQTQQTLAPLTLSLSTDSSNDASLRCFLESFYEPGRWDIGGLLFEARQYTPPNSAARRFYCSADGAQKASSNNCGSVIQLLQPFSAADDGDYDDDDDDSRSALERRCAAQASQALWNRDHQFSYAHRYEFNSFHRPDASLFLDGLAATHQAAVNHELPTGSRSAEFTTTDHALLACIESGKFTKLTVMKVSLTFLLHCGSSLHGLLNHMPSLRKLTVSIPEVLLPLNTAEGEYLNAFKPISTVSSSGGNSGSGGNSVNTQYMQQRWGELVVVLSSLVGGGAPGGCSDSDHLLSYSYQKTGEGPTSNGVEIVVEALSLETYSFVRDAVRGIRRQSAGEGAESEGWKEVRLICGDSMSCNL